MVTVLWSVVVTGILILAGLAVIVGLLDDHATRTAWHGISIARRRNGDVSRAQYTRQQELEKWEDDLTAWEIELRAWDGRLRATADRSPPDPGPTPTLPGQVDFETEDDREARTEPFRAEPEEPGNEQTA
ncbi:hypothetical protein [Pseudonocardia sp. ICBG1034]|uniref:hypothetical protein n=1 Tax=Pseudonocardia sp. ICBG1034 TaxID=2844381 RepID=UPI001CCA3459|nr:hypothetical protein [Pseudonocardia sp. ICBG1034]